MTSMKRGDDRADVDPEVWPFEHAADLVVRELVDETLVYDRQRHEAYCLGPLLAAVWRACDRRSTVEEIQDRLTRAGTPVDQTVVLLALNRLRRARLIGGPSLPRPDPSSRRNALKRIAALGGLTIASITAPTALQAATCTADRKSVV